MDEFMMAAMEEARLGMAEGGVPIGSVLVLDGKIVGRGHNRQAQMQSIIRHAEMDAIDRAGFLPPADYRRAVLYTTLSPCEMCAGAVAFFASEEASFITGNVLVIDGGMTVKAL